ncbi:GDP-mannose 4,6-dehydratase-like protein [Methanobrevibacter arboriphilus JCM 13429 = DSM 1125]|uniref:GDP-mannose 4,6-dehydratase n=2 Tax=Methanobrevibacter arboriphilus TaxID=39441 RepID=A0A1V6N2D8_METAZ|nr:GDP-mannose 4,6-dehydratase [Methanobrevibacter arboriphilus]OQD58841.1 GDP-mannose 4,6-dehydratase-like protein [Methanobrevibacter arboriphilus JCM 13429 = DSM 1125]
MNWKNKKVFITGISGFVGSYLTKELLERGANVSGFDRKIKKNPIIDLKTDNLNIFEGNLLDKKSVDNVLNDDFDFVFHLAAQPFIPRSFENPKETHEVNGVGTLNLLESIVSKDLDSKIVFSSSSDEYGLVFSSKQQYLDSKEKYGNIFPEPVSFPELPISENNPLRPMSPYAVSKVYGDFLMRNYYHAYGLNTVVSRSFSHEGPGRGEMFVTSVITSQINQYNRDLIDNIIIGNVNVFRDWSHVEDIVNGYLLLADKGLSGDVYNQGSMRTNSILTYILLSLESSGYEIDKIETINNDKIVKNPTETDDSKLFGLNFYKTKLDKLMIDGDINFTLDDKGVIVFTNSEKIRIIFDESRFRPADVPILLADNKKIRNLGFKTKYNIKNIINDQLNYFN